MIEERNPVSMSTTPVRFVRGFDLDDDVGFLVLRSTLARRFAEAVSGAPTGLVSSVLATRRWRPEGVVLAARPTVVRRNWGMPTSRISTPASR